MSPKPHGCTYREGWQTAAACGDPAWLFFRRPTSKGDKFIARCSKHAVHVTKNDEPIEENEFIVGRLMES